jgi:GH35 family endo-1,4-beta-xylanase
MIEPSTLNEALEAYYKSVTEPHSDEYWDKVNATIASEQNKSRLLHKQFIPSPQLMQQRFDI